MMPERSWGSLERRSAPRYVLPLRVELAQETGYARDISSSGLYFELTGSTVAASYSLGSVIELTLVFEHTDQRGPFRLLCAGTIVRIERRKDILGIAGCFTAFKGGPNIS
jgi:hypothetical protein